MFFVIALVLLCAITIPETLRADTHPTIEIADVTQAEAGSLVTVPIRLTNPDADLIIESFDLQVSFFFFLELQNVEMGQLLTDCGWDDFQYSMINDSTVSIHASAGSNPQCALGAAAGDLVYLTFNVYSESQYCSKFPVRFLWTDCTSNVLWTANQEIAYVDYLVRDYYYKSTLATAGTLPSQAGLPDSCLNEISASAQPLREFEFISGILSGYTEPECYCTGDLNLNNMFNELEDAYIYWNYFVYGPVIFIINMPKQIANSDVNNDGRVLTVTDAILQLNTIIPQIDDPEIEEGDTAVFIQYTNDKKIVFDYPDTIFMVNLYFDDEIQINNLAPNLRYIKADGHDNYLIAPRDIGSRTCLVPGTIFEYSGSGQLVSADFCYDFGSNNLKSRVEIKDGLYCGDANGDTNVNISDAVYIIGYVFSGGNPPKPYISGDVNCDSAVNVSDAVYLINFVFSGGSEPCDTDRDSIPDCF